MRKLYLIYLLLTVGFIGISYKIKDDYFYLPYPNAIEYILASMLLLGMLISLYWHPNRKKKLALGFTSIVTLLLSVYLLNYFFEWHPLTLSLPFTKSQSFEVSYEPYAWEVATPSSLAYDEHTITQYIQEIESWERVRGILVIKDDKILIEKYLHGATRYSAFNVHSITKSITSALIGLAIQKEYLRSENEWVIPFFAEYSATVTDNHPKRLLTIAHLLSMRGGFSGYDGPQNVEQTIIHERLAKGKTGRDFHYFTGSHMVLSAILTKVSGSPTKKFAHNALFMPLGMQCGFWRKVDGYYCGGDETYFTARDIARFGNLYLNKGKINGVQLLDSLWVEKSFTNYTIASKDFRALDCYQEIGYGFSWWLLKYKDTILYAARGKGGQYLLLLPEQKMVVVILQEWNLQKDFKRENGFLCQLLSMLIKEKL